MLADQMPIATWSDTYFSAPLLLATSGRRASNEAAPLVWDAPKPPITILVRLDWSMWIINIIELWRGVHRQYKQTDRLCQITQCTGHWRVRGHRFCHNPVRSHCHQDSKCIWVDDVVGLQWAKATTVHTHLASPSAVWWNGIDCTNDRTWWFILLLSWFLCQLHCTHCKSKPIRKNYDQ